jgi:hypothetical protein
LLGLTGAIATVLCIALLKGRRLKQFGVFFLASTLLSLAGCMSSGTVLTQTVQLLGRQMLSGEAADGLPADPDPRFRYLRLEVEGSTPAMLVLAFVDPHPMGEIEVWYSAQNQVIKLQNGRIVASHGLAVDWTKVHFPVAPPAWGDIRPEGSQFERERDEVPAYRYGLKERLSVQPVDLPAGVVVPGPINADMAKRYAWFRETATAADGVKSTAWYALEVQMGRSVVVYSEQCLKPDFCLRLQRWPVNQRAL